VAACELTVSRQGKQIDGVRIRFRMARAPADARHPQLVSYPEWVAMNVWRVKLAFVSGGEPAVDLVFDLERETVFAATADAQTYEGAWRPSASDQRGGLLAEVLSRAGSVRYGTSVWFVGSTGLAAPPDEVTWLER
jgi:hypothetical protein